MRMLQKNAPALLLVIVFILMRFRPSTLIQHVCVFVLIHLQQRFQIGYENTQRISTGERPKRT